MRNILCKIGFHNWITRVTAYDKYGVGNCGKVKTCVDCGKIKRTGVAIIPKSLKNEAI